MTTSRYIIARFAQAFGYLRKNQRMGDAATEMHLLREAEAHLGFSIWKNVENIDELSVEYWNLRKFVKEKAEISEKLEECQERLNKAHEDRASMLNSVPEVHQELLDERHGILTELETLARRRDEIVAEAREIRRSYDGTKMKLEVLGKESAGAGADESEVANIKKKLVQLKARFAELKQLRADIGEQIEEGDAKIDQVDRQLDDKKKDRRVHASEAFHLIGENNKEMSTLRAESALLDTQMRQLYAEIGRYVSRHAATHEGCAKASASERGLVAVMQALRRSIALNHRLAGTA